MSFIFAFLSGAGSVLLGISFLVVAFIGCGLMWGRLWERFAYFALGRVIDDVGNTVMIAGLLGAIITACAIWSGTVGSAFLVVLGLLAVSLVVLIAVELYIESGKVDPEFD